MAPSCVLFRACTPSLESNRVAPHLRDKNLSHREKGHLLGGHTRSLLKHFAHTSAASPSGAPTSQRRLLERRTQNRLLPSLFFFSRLSFLFAANLFLFFYTSFSSCFNLRSEYFYARLLFNLRNRCPPWCLPHFPTRNVINITLLAHKNNTTIFLSP